ncbi:thioredoxin domain-containing protein [Tissierella sp. Yu-01]|uniref:thioredoxin domain-containing protein n=1 Tax=Tissierella sp. Yu-01 TaxID=3035694 RepID=UPI00240E31C3|nr:thioredoxin domain-containing protein [Tissierella sp. Yu-01]WFA09909.1 thioredoxin domain-containing protein [Tissierella sp. Yu-01]
MNRLIHEKSPYLLQHKDNPVDWYPWGKEALNKAKEENKLLFISIGYSTCHWCHVMNRESFSDNEVAEVLNKYYVPIKVDREERPDVDKVYMTFAEVMNGNAGWPLNVIATPEAKPLYVGTYFPKQTQDRMIGIIELLNKIDNAWKEDSDSLVKNSEEILNEIKKINLYEEGNISEDINTKALKVLKSIYDKENGGFGNRPKFPMPQYLLYLLKYGEMNDDKVALEIAEDTLVKMYKGGLFDHIGYGFFRYSVDEHWLVPHFEKMLYDNALLSLVYTKAYEISSNPLFKDVAEKIYEFVLRDMISENGGFYSALDADSEGEEGKFYLFESEEVVDLLGKEWGDIFNKYYDITKQGNFEGKNIPNLIKTDLDSIPSNDEAILNSIIQMLFSYREKRVSPHRDEKILTAWNGLMIGSLAYAGRIFGNNFYLKKARESINFIINNLFDEYGNLLSTHIGGSSYNYGFLEDYTFFIFGLINLYKATKESKDLELAQKLTKDMLELFGDENNGLYFYSYKSEQLILRPKEFYDGAIPSGNGFALINLFNLYVITGDEKYSKIAKDILYSFGDSLNKSPLAHLYSLIAINSYM